MLIFSFIAVVLLIGIDQLIKFWAVGSLQEQGSIQFIHFGNFEVFDLTYLENSGAVFGSFAGMRWLLVGITSVMLIACAWGLVHFNKRSKLLTSSLILILAGGVGNLIDRLFRDGMVIDYIEVKFFDFAIFNFADCCVVIGIALFIFYILFIDSKATVKNKNENAVGTEDKDA